MIAIKDHPFSFFSANLLAFFLLFSPILQADDRITITVFEKGSGDPIEGATVVDIATGKIENSDQQGVVYFANASFPLNLKIIQPGYFPLQLTIEKPQSKLSIFIEPQSNDGNTLEIVADRIVEKTSKVVLTKEELRKAPGSQGDPLRTIRDLPGVLPAGEFRGGVYIRGSGQEDNLFWANRLPIGYLFHFFPVSVINPDAIDDFNILLGGFGAEYDNVVGGVVDISLIKPRRDKWRKKARIAINESAISTEGGGSLYERPFGYFFSVRKSYFDVFLTPGVINRLAGNTEATDNQIITLPKYYDTQAMVRYDINDNGSLELIYLNASDAFGLAINKLDNASAETRGDLAIENGFYTTGLNWRQRWNSNLDSRLTITTEKFLQYFQFGTDPVTQEPYYLDGSYRTSTMQPELHRQFAPSHDAYFGIHMSYGIYPIKARATQRPSEEEQQTDIAERTKYSIDTTLKVASYSPYFKYRAVWFDRLTTNLGARYAHYFGSTSYDTAGWMPRASAEYALTENLTLLGAWGIYMQPPRQSDIVSGIGNPDLVLTKSEHRITGIKYQINPLWEIDFETYYKTMWDLVLSFPNQTAPANYQNAGRGRAYGADFYLKRRFADRKFGWISLSYIDVTRTNDLTGQQRNFSGDQPLSLTAIWSQALPGTWNRWEFGFKFEARSGKPYTPVVGRQAICTAGGQYAPCADQTNPESDPTTFSYWKPIRGGTNSARLPVYYKIDARIDRVIRFNTWKMNLYLDLQNVTMRENVTSYDYGNKYENFANPKPVAFLPFILPIFGVEAEF